jgi:hypothetical protein
MDPRVCTSSDLSRRNQDPIDANVVHASVHTRRKSCPSNAGPVEKAAGEVLRTSHERLKAGTQQAPRF